MLAFLAGMTMWLRYYVPTQASQDVQDGFLLWVRIIVSFAVILGILSVLRYHGLKIKGRKPGFAFSYVTIISFVFMSFAGFSTFTWFGIFAEGTARGAGMHQWLYDNAMLPMQATMFATLAFFIASAAFRAFRARSPEATALLIAAIILMIGRVPLGNQIAVQTPGFEINETTYHLLDFPAWQSWLLNVPNTAAFRGIQLGVYLSQVAISVRIIFGIERTYMGGGD